MTKRFSTDAEIFREVMNRYRNIQAAGIASGRRALRDREFLADVENVARHSLSPRQYEFWRLAYVWAVAPGTIRLKLGIVAELDYRFEADRVANVFGRACKDIRPYPLWPLDDYFRPPSRRSACQTP